MELHFQSKAYPITKAEFAGLFFKPPGSILMVPSDSLLEFRSLKSFLSRRDYEPDIRDRQDRYSTVTRQGPPQIVERSVSDRSHIPIDIGAYRLAKEMSFEDLRQHALTRLYAQATTTDDPCHVLELIYHTLARKHRDKDLRDWVKEWLKVPTKHPLSIKFANNLQILQKHVDYKSKYVKLREKGSEMITDIDLVEADLAMAKSSKQQKESSDPKQQHNSPGGSSSSQQLTTQESPSSQSSSSGKKDDSSAKPPAFPAKVQINREYEMVEDAVKPGTYVRVKRVVISQQDSC